MPALAAPQRIHRPTDRFHPRTRLTSGAFGLLLPGCCSDVLPSRRSKSGGSASFWMRATRRRPALLLRGRPSLFCPRTDVAKTGYGNIADRPTYSVSHLVLVSDARRSGPPRCRRQAAVPPPRGGRHFPPNRSFKTFSEMFWRPPTDSRSDHVLLSGPGVLTGGARHRCTTCGEVFTTRVDALSDAARR